jgi:hypothetical protein
MNISKKKFTKEEQEVIKRYLADRASKNFKKQTTDQLKENGKKAMSKRWGTREPIACPHCGSLNTVKTAEQMRCKDCKKYFKPTEGDSDGTKS